MPSQLALRRDRFSSFLHRFEALLDQVPDEPGVISQGSALLGDLVRHDDWLPDAYAAPHPTAYQQYLLHRDATARFSVVSFVWGPGQSTPVHNHTVWGLVGMLRGAEVAQSYRRSKGALVAEGPPRRLAPGDIDAVSPTLGDLHQVSNALSDRPSISIHVYGADIGTVQRSVFTIDGAAKPFVSGYADMAPPPFFQRAD